MRELAALALLVAVAAGCATANPHVELPRAPRADAPYDARAAYFKAYSLDTRDGNALFLHGGTRVYWPEDLLPAVDDASPTAMAVRDHVAARKKVEAYAWLGDTATVASVAGLGVMTLSLAPLFLVIGSHPAISSDDAGVATLSLLVGGGVILAGGVGVTFLDQAIVGHDADVAGEAADRAARTYPQALSDRLGVGVDADGRIVDHGMVPSLAAPTATPAQKEHSL